MAPVWNEAQILPEFCRRVTAVMEGLGDPYEIILVDDGSRDGSRELAQSLSEADPRIRCLSFARNFGHQVAITAGIDFASGQAVIILDSDLQDPPEVIPNLIAAWRDGYDVVYATRVERQGESAFKLFTASLFYRLIRRITAVDIPRDTGDFRLMDRRVVRVLRRLREHHRFMRGLSAWVGFRQRGVPYERHARYAGETKYPFRKMLRLATDAVTSFSYVPLQIATSIGFTLAVLAFVGIVITVVARLLGQQVIGQGTTIVMVLFIGAVQLMCLGAIGEYVGRIYDEVKGRPLYIVDEAVGFVDDEDAAEPGLNGREGATAGTVLNPAAGELADGERRGAD